MTWFFLTLGAALCWGIAQVLIKKGFDHLSPLWNNIINNALTLFIWIIPVLFINNFSINKPSRYVLIIIFTASSLYHIFFYAISRGQISLTGTVVAGYPLITIILSYIFLSERLTLLQYMGIALILSGSIIVILPENKTPKENGNLSWILWGLSGAVTIGVGDFLSKLSIDSIGAFSHLFFLSVISNAVSFFNYTMDRNNRRVPKIFHQRLLSSLTGLIINLAGVFLFFLAFDYGKVSLVIGVSSIYPVFMVVLAIKFLKERITIRQSAGIATIACGLLLVGFSSGA
jgi:uncharacterized membrane protein